MLLPEKRESEFYPTLLSTKNNKEFHQINCYYNQDLHQSLFTNEFTIVFIKQDCANLLPLSIKKRELCSM